MKKQIEGKRSKKIEELEEIIKEVWNGLSLDYLKILIKSVPNRISKCIEVKEEMIGY